MYIENIRKRGGIKKAEEIKLNISEDKKHFVEDIYYDVLHQEDLIGYHFNVGEYWTYQSYEGGQNLQGRTKNHINEQLSKSFGYETRESMQKNANSDIDEFVIYEMESRLDQIMKNTIKVIEPAVANVLLEYKRLIEYTKKSLPPFTGSQYTRILRKAMIESRKSIDEIIDAVNSKVNSKGHKLSKLHLTRLQNGNIQPAPDDINQAIAEVLNINPLDLITLAYIEKIPQEVLERLRNDAIITKE
jgi:hypothetical protein